MTRAAEQRVINWDYAAYWTEIRLSNIPERAKTLLRFLFDTFKRTKEHKLELSVLEVLTQLKAYGVKMTDVTLRRAVNDLKVVQILDVEQRSGNTSVWRLHERQLWLINLPDSDEEVALRIRRRLADLEAEKAELTQQLRVVSRGVPSTTLNNPQPPPAPPPPSSPTCHDMSVSLNRNLQTDITSHPSTDPPPAENVGGWDLNFEPGTLLATDQARPNFQRLVSLGLMEDTPETEAEFFAFLLTVYEKTKKKNAKPVRNPEAYAATALRRGYWRSSINPNLRDRADRLQAELNATTDGERDVEDHSSNLR